jgi:hypothetical protein
MWKSLIGAVAATLALGGAAVAFADASSRKLGEAGGAVGAGSVAAGPFMAFGEAPDASFAKDLAAELGVSSEEVEQALEAVAQKRRAEHQRQMAEALSEQLDGVSVDQIEAALAVAEDEMRQAFEDREPPAPDQFTATMADELGLSDDEIADALAAVRQEAFSAPRGERRFGPVGPPPGRPGVSFAVPGGLSTQPPLLGGPGGRKSDRPFFPPLRHSRRTMR